MEEDKKTQETINIELQPTPDTKEISKSSNLHEVNKDSDIILESDDSLEGDNNPVIVPNKFMSATHCFYGDEFSISNKKVVKNLNDKDALNRQLALFKFDLDNFMSGTVAQLKGQYLKDALLECGWFVAFMNDHFYMEHFSKNETFSYEEIESASSVVKDKIDNILNYSEVINYVESF